MIARLLMSLPREGTEYSYHGFAAVSDCIKNLSYFPRIIKRVFAFYLIYSGFLRIFQRIWRILASFSPPGTSFMSSLVIVRSEIVMNR